MLARVCRARRWGSRWTASGLLALLVLAGCGLVPAPPVGVPTPGPVPTSEAPPSDPTDGAPGTVGDAVRSYLDSCERGLREWRPAQVNYPGSLALDIGDSETYVAQVDIRQAPTVPDARIPGPDATSAAIYVRCAIAARLRTDGDTVEVGGENDWVFREFTPTGLVDWSWRVAGKKIGDQDVWLELQPAVQTDDDFTFIAGGPQTLTYPTDVVVGGNPMQHLAQWIDDNQAAAAGIFLALTAGLGALVKWGADLAAAVREMVRAWTGRPAPAPADAPEAGHPGADPPPPADPD